MAAVRQLTTTTKGVGVCFSILLQKDKDKDQDIEFNENWNNLHILRLEIFYCCLFLVLGYFMTF